MKDYRKVKRSQLPSSLPITPTIAIWLMLDRFNAHVTWIGGIAYFLLACVWLGSIVSIVTEEQVSVFKESR